MLKNLLGKLACYFRGHKRGTFSHFDGTKKVYKCPRCSRETRYQRQAPTA